MELLSTPAGWTGFLLELLARSSVILALAFAAAFLLRRASAGLRHLVWHVCLLSLLLLPLGMVWLPALEIQVARAPGPAVSGVASSLSAAAVSRGLSAGETLWLPLWLVAASALLLYAALGILRIRQVTRQARPPRDPALTAALDTLAEEEGMLRRVRLLESPVLRAPLSWGLMRPVILLPAAERWETERLQSVLLHELSHIRRFDWAGQLLCRVACALYCFHPLVWLAAARLAEEAERACDDEVVLHGKAGWDYAADLLAIAGKLGGGRMRWLADAAASSFLGRRVRAILNSEQRRAGWEEVFLLRALLVSLVLLVVISTVRLVPEISVTEVNRAFTNLIPVSLSAQEHVGPADSRVAATPLPLVPDVPIEAPPDESWQAPALAPAVSVRWPPLTDLAGAEVPAHEPAAPGRFGGEPVATAAPAGAESIEPLAAPSPRYPEAAKRRGIEGFVLLQYDIDEQGRVSNPVVLESSPGSVFKRASLEAIRGYRYRPQRLDGEPVAIRGLRARFVYRLNPKPG